MSDSVWMKERAGASHREAVLRLTLPPSPSFLMEQVRQLQKLTAQTSSRAAQTSTCVLVPSACSLLPICHPPHFHLTPAQPCSPNCDTSMTLYSLCLHPLLSPKPKYLPVPFQILLFSLALIILPSFSPFQGQSEARPEDYQLHGGKRQGYSSPKDEPRNNSPKQSTSRSSGPVSYPSKWSTITLSPQ